MMRAQAFMIIKFNNNPYLNALSSSPSPFSVSRSKLKGILFSGNLSTQILSLIFTFVMA